MNRKEKFLLLKNSATNALWSATSAPEADNREFLFTNSASTVGAKAIAGFARVGILLTVARVYGPGTFGQVSLAISLVEILRTFSEFGIDTVAIRKFSQTAVTHRPALLARVVGTKLLLGAVFYCLGGGALFFITRDRTEILIGLIAALALFFASVLGGISSYFQSSFSMSRVLMTTFLSSAVSVILAAAAMYERGPVWAVIIALPAADALNLLLLSRRLGAAFRIHVSLTDTLELLKESLPLGIMAVLAVLYIRLDSIFLFKLSGEYALGLYAFCYRIAEPGLLLPYAFSTTTYTLLSGPKHQHCAFSEAVLTVVKAMWPAYAGIAGVVAIVLVAGKPLLSQMAPGYLLAYPILAVVFINLLVRTINISLTAMLNSRGKYATLAKISAANLTVNLLLVSLLVPRWGALGASCAALGTESINAVLQSRSVLSAFTSRSQSVVSEIVHLGSVAE
jgi:O-antigen/teichoic acid export membrane protein